MKNVFVVNTPFQLFVVRRIIKQYYPNTVNIIISTIEGKEYQDVTTIPHGIRSVVKARQLIKEIRRNTNDEHFFIPHLGNLFSSYLFELSRKYNIPISVYYEGTALFYDPIVKNKRAGFKRFAVGLMMGIRYKHYSQLFPPELLERADCCFSPVNANSLKKYKDIKSVTLFEKRTVDKNNNILLLSSDTASHDEIMACVDCVKDVIDDSKQVLYFKAHYVLDEDSLNSFISEIKKINGIELVLLNQRTPIETLIESTNFKYVVCQCFTSAIINMNFMYGPGLKFSVINKDTIPISVTQELGIEIN